MHGSRQSSPPADRVRGIFVVFLSDKLEPRRTSLLQRSDTQPELTKRLTNGRAHLRTHPRRRAVETRERTPAGTIAADVIASYPPRRNRRGLLDYDELIDKAGRLLADVDAAWCTTSSISASISADRRGAGPQARTVEIIRRLVAEFASARGASDASIFAVATKASIFRPGRRAAPVRPSARPVPAHYERSLIPPPRVQAFIPLPARKLRRPPVFRSPEVFVSVTTDGSGIPPHIAVRDQSPGLVELWPMIEPDEKREIELDLHRSTKPRNQPRCASAQASPHGQDMDRGSGWPSGSRAVRR